MAAESLPGDDLTAMFDIVWQQLARAVADAGSALRWPVVATSGVNGPSARVMVLRNVDRDACTLWFYTDLRAAKVVEVSVDSRIAVTGYDPEARLQLRLQGEGRMLTGAAVASRWQEIGVSGRKAYATLRPPGSRLDEPGSGLPHEISAADAEANFAVLEVRVDQLEWLLLASSGHRRARYKYVDGAWRSSWCVP